MNGDPMNDAPPTNFNDSPAPTPTNNDSAQETPTTVLCGAMSGINALSLAAPLLLLRSRTTRRRKANAPFVKWRFAKW